MSVPFGYKSELLNSGECNIMRRATKAFFNHASFMKVDPQQIYSILQLLDRLRINHAVKQEEIARLRECVLRLETERDIARHGLQEAFDTYHDWTNACQCARQMADNIETALRLSEPKP